jgi:hypothetical protein
MRYSAILVLLLAGCSNPTPPAPPPLPPLPSAWAAYAYGVPGRLEGPLTNDSFAFPQCSGSPLPCSVGYIEHGWGTVTGKMITLRYEITGNNPVFDFHTNSNNTCEPPPPSGDWPNISLLIHRAGDDLSKPFFRYYSVDKRVLAVGADQLAVPIDASAWINALDGTPADAPDFNLALTNVGSLGFVFGGGCFRAHGVAITSGDATFSIKDFVVQ